MVDEPQIITRGNTQYALEPREEARQVLYTLEKRHNRITPE